jgi:hypothetical protein
MDDNGPVDALYDGELAGSIKIIRTYIIAVLAANAIKVDDVTLGQIWGGVLVILSKGADKPGTTKPHKLTELTTKFIDDITAHCAQYDKKFYIDDCMRSAIRKLTRVGCKKI